MLQFLRIENFALIDLVEIDLSSGLTIITGETGAGKSIIVDGMLALLGARRRAEVVRDGAAKAVIDGTFLVENNADIAAFLRNNDLEPEVDSGELFVRREITRRGGSRSFINDRPATQTLVRELGAMLIDFHGQHDHQSLLRPELHRGLLDRLAETEAAQERYRSAYRTLTASARELKTLTERERELRAQEEFSRFRLREIEDVDPGENELEELEQDIKLRENAELIFEQTQVIADQLYENDGAVHDVLSGLRDKLEDLSELDPEFAAQRDECNSALVAVEEIARFARAYNDAIDFDRERLEEMRERSLQLQALRKRFGTMKEVFSERTRLREELRLTEHFEEEIAACRERIDAAREDVARRGAELSKMRRATGQKLAQSVARSMRELGIKHAQFEVRIGHNEAAGDDGVWVKNGGKKVQAWNHGLDTVEFYVATNPGMDVRPLAKTASGGEISRIMLALKSMVAAGDHVATLVFDEIDTGISGGIAQKVGRAMKSLAGSRQILSITHLPQIAALADRHILVRKENKKGLVKVHVQSLESDDRTREVARLLSGEKISDASLASARELMLVE